MSIFMICGQDARSRACAQALCAKGHRVTQEVGLADVIVLPMKARLPDDLPAGRRPDALILGGCLEGTCENARDYYRDAILPQENAVPTAEGAIGILMDALPMTIQGSKGLIVGYGRIGRILAQKLALLGAQITVSARKAADLGAIRAAGFRDEQTGCYRHGLGSYDYIVNTVPAAVFAPGDYRAMRPDCFLLELASAPGGIDEAACRAHGLRCRNAPGLPGLCAPQTAGAAIADAILRILKQEDRYAT